MCIRDSAGVYESIKAGLIRDAALFRFIESRREQIDKGDPASLEKMVAASIRIKACLLYTSRCV